ncbi:MAG: hypothetical protein IJS93_00485 [Clostridia bacterium]|nr:hypothetical protein [Clostridia bacterium]
MNRVVPVIIVNGLLEAGKTHFLNEAIDQETFIDASAKGVILQCEEGLEEYDESVLKRNHLTVISFDNESDFTESKLKEIVTKYDPDVVYIEHNAMWTKFELPDWMEVNQTLTVIDASTFRVFLNNMRQKIVDILTPSEVVIMYNCDDQKEVSALKRNIMVINRNLNFLLFDSNGRPVSLEDDLPYKLCDEITLKDDDYAVFYFEMNEYPERYFNKYVTFLAKINLEKKLPKGFFLASRLCMTCCVNDIQPLFTICDNRSAKVAVKDDSWGIIRGQIKYNQDPEGRPIPYLELASVTPASAPENEVLGLQQ